MRKINFENVKKSIELILKFFQLILEVCFLIFIVYYYLDAKKSVSQLDFVIEEISLPDQISQKGINSGYISSILKNSFKAINDTIRLLDTKGEDGLNLDRLLFKSDYVGSDYRFEIQSPSYWNNLLKAFIPKPKCSLRLNFSLSDSSNKLILNIEFLSHEELNKNISWFMSKKIKNGETETAIFELIRDATIWITWAVKPRATSSYLINISDKKEKAVIYKLLNSYLSDQWIKRDHSDDSWVYEDLATASIQLDNFSQAEKYYKIAAKKSSDKKRIKRKQILLSLLMGRLDEGIRELAEISKTYPNDVELKELKIFTLMFQNNIDSCENYIDQFLEEVPTNTRVMGFKMALALIGKTNIEKLKAQIGGLSLSDQVELFKSAYKEAAIYSPIYSLFSKDVFNYIDTSSMFGKFIYFDPFSYDKLAFSDMSIEEVISHKITQDLLNYYPGSIFAWSYKLSQMTLASTTTDPIKEFNNLVKEKPDMKKSVIVQWINCLASDGNQSLKISREFSQAYPYDFAYFAISTSFLESGNLDSSRFYYNYARQKALNKELVDVAWAHILSSSGYSFLGDSLFSYVIAENKTSLDFNVSYSRFLMDWAERDQEDSIQTPHMLNKLYNRYMKAYSYNNSNYDNLVMAAVIRRRQKQFLESKRIYQYILSLDSNNVFANYEFSILLKSNLKDEKQAKVCYNKAINQANSPSAWVNIYRNFYFEKKYGEAVQSINFFHSKYPTDPTMTNYWKQLN